MRSRLRCKGNSKLFLSRKAVKIELKKKKKNFARGVRFMTFDWRFFLFSGSHDLQARLMGRREFTNEYLKWLNAFSSQNHKWLIGNEHQLSHKKKQKSDISPTPLIAVVRFYYRCRETSYNVHMLPSKRVCVYVWMWRERKEWKIERERDCGKWFSLQCSYLFSSILGVV